MQTIPAPDKTQKTCLSLEFKERVHSATKTVYGLATYASPEEEKQNKNFYRKHFMEMSRVAFAFVSTESFSPRKWTALTLKFASIRSPCFSAWLLPHPYSGSGDKCASSSSKKPADRWCSVLSVLLATGHLLDQPSRDSRCARRRHPDGRIKDESHAPLTTRH